MSGVQPSLDQQHILTLLNTHFTGAITDLAPLSGGNVAQTLRFTTNGQIYVLRLVTDRMGASFKKETDLYERLAPHIPIPRVYHTGHFQDVYYAISQHVPGKPMTQLSWQENEQLLPSLVELADSIHHSDISNTSGYGTIDDAGTGFFPSWRKSLLFVAKEETEGEFYGKWHTLFEQTFLERDRFESVYQRMKGLLDFCPEDRYLLHGGPAYGNILAQDGKITAVLDWLDAQYGDFVRDIAGMDFWEPRFRFAERFQQFYAARGETIPNYSERLRCYQCQLALDAMRFYAKANDKRSYTWLQERIRSLLA
jgi:hygromycin-B 4-O-kinase